MKSFKEFLESEAPINVSGPSIATTPVPIFKKKKWAGMDEFEVDHDTYVSVREGRTKGSRWDSFIADENLRGEIRKAFDANRHVVVSSTIGPAIKLTKYKGA